MMIKMSLVVMVTLAATVQAGVLPHLMFAAAGRTGQQQQQQQQQQPWSIHHPKQQQKPQQQQQILGDPYANYLERAAALMAASSSAVDLDIPVQQPVYGIPHRYLSDPIYPLLPANQMMGQQKQINRPDLLATYSGNPLFSSGMSSLYKNNKRSVIGSSGSGSGYSNYDLMAAMLSADLAAEEQQQAAAASSDYLEDEPIINQQDALNFENYIQRFFQQQVYDNDNNWSDEAAADVFDDDSQFDWDVPQQQQQLMDNDEEAAQQLHLLLQQVEQQQQKQQQQRSRPALPLNIQKKSGTPVTTTEAPLPVATPMTVSANQQGGQKEEAMLRPPAQAKQQQSPSTTTTTTTSAPQPTYGTKKSSIPKNEDTTKSAGNKSIYRTIHRLMADDSSEKVEGNSDRAKRFVPYNPESVMLNNQLHALDKIKAK